MAQDEESMHTRIMPSRSHFIKGINLILLLPALWAILAACAGRGPLSEVNLERVLEDAERKSSVVNRFRAEFVKTRHTSVFSRALTVQGRLVFQKPDKFKLTTAGDVNLEVMSDGKLIALTHDGRDQEIYSIEGGRDLSAFADPLVLLLRGLGKGALKQYPILNQVQEQGTLMVELGPGKENRLGKIDRVFLWLSESGALKRVKLLFSNGDFDDITFRSWTLLARNAPEILDLQLRLKELPQRMPPRARTADALRDGLVSKY